jgi:hypothetical protein
MSHGPRQRATAFARRGDETTDPVKAAHIEPID